MSDYIFTTHDGDSEWQRLCLIEAALDPATFAVLKKLPIGSGWRCLELGAGAGSVIAFMGDAVGRHGEVVGVDKQTRYLTGFDSAPYRIVSTEVCGGGPDSGDNSLFEENHFDLAHCRYMLIHNQTARDMVRHMSHWVRPGGYIVVEEPDFTCSRRVFADGEERGPVDRAIDELFRGMGLNPAYGLHLPTEMETAGLEIIHVSAAQHLCPGGHPVAVMMEASAHALREKYISTGKARAADVDAYVRDCQDPNRWLVYYATITVTARVPA